MGAAEPDHVRVTREGAASNLPDIDPTAGRTTQVGEWLQHADGQSPLLAATNPAVLSYDPAFACKIAYIIEEGLRRMYGEHSENVFYYLTIYNQPQVQPAELENFDSEGVQRGIYRYGPAAEGRTDAANLMASGVSMPDALWAADMLAAERVVASDVWSVTRSRELARDGEVDPSVLAARQCRVDECRPAPAQQRAPTSASEPAD
jgi:pyruvate dehydrogenase E1 component